MTKFLLSIESVLDSFGFTKQRGICGSLRLTPFLRFFPKSGRNQNQKESAMGSLAPGKECGGERYGESCARERVWGGGGRGEQKNYISVTSFEPPSSRVLRHSSCPCAHLCSSMERKNVAFS